MEPKTICQWCVSRLKRIKEFVQRLCRRQPSESARIEIEKPERVEGLPVEPITPEKPRKITFTYHDLDAKEVKLVGDFTNWKQRLFTKKSHGDWNITVELLPGRYYYKYVVDNIWIRDPNNPKSEPDKYGGRRSIIEVQ